MVWSKIPLDTDLAIIVRRNRLSGDQHFRPLSGPRKAMVAPSALSASSRKIPSGCKTCRHRGTAPGQRTYNNNWIIQRHGYQTPAQVRRQQLQALPLAARVGSVGSHTLFPQLTLGERRRVSFFEPFQVCYQEVRMVTSSLGCPAAQENPGHYKASQKPD